MHKLVIDELRPQPILYIFKDGKVASMTLTYQFKYWAECGYDIQPDPITDWFKTHPLLEK